uniref:Ig-like domain-containing protein n=1 Tax=Callorhinchus milii TaxID=7868 RepID=A0A4W3IT28_CALMI
MSLRIRPPLLMLILTVSSQSWEGAQEVSRTQIIQGFPQKAPKIVQDMSNVTVLLGEAASLKCQILAFPKPEVTWSREGQEIIELEGVKIVTIPEAEVLVSSELTIPNIKEEDGGMYRCKAVNALGEGQCEAEITVLEVPKILIELSDLRVNSGQVAQFICSFQEGSFSEVAWNHGDRRLEESERLKIAQNEKDHGEYSCTVSNQVGEVKTTAVLINLKPSFTQKLKFKSVMEGEQATFECKLVASPAPKIAWFHNNRPIRKDLRKNFKIESAMHIHSSSLEINNVEQKDSGSYKVFAINSEGSAETTLISSTLGLPSTSMQLKELWGIYTIPGAG